MLRALYSAAAGMQSQQMNLDVISNNLANANTTGYKATKLQFQDLLYENISEAGSQQGGGNMLPTSLQIGQGSVPVATERSFTQGDLTQTGNNLDVAIQGQGFFEVQMPDGTYSYTRDGSFKTDAQGRIVTNDGYPLMGGFQPVPTGTTTISITASGAATYATPSGNRISRSNWRGSPTPAAWTRWDIICTRKPPLPARRNWAHRCLRQSAAGGFFLARPGETKLPPRKSGRLRDDEVGALVGSEGAGEQNAVGSRGRCCSEGG